ncbi:UNVERIFIED_CONTAM: Polyadenylate-binding protein-interacting protein 11 [Sesamum calycinum]|uniref:Polyadenylate-binding protein-interacting protein 11 n=1 Tax=Sesamum calycinum TaxID=2727403 RepID=A0AAW2RQT5_9LAMI
MAVVENAGVNAMPSSNRDGQQTDPAVDHHNQQLSTKPAANSQKSTKPADQNYHLMQQKMTNGHPQLQQHSINGNGVPQEKKMNEDDDGGEGFKREMRDLEEMLSKLNPMAEEFVPPSLAPVVVGGHPGWWWRRHMQQQQLLLLRRQGILGIMLMKKNGYTNGKRRVNSRTSMAQREDVIRRTVYVSDIDHQVTEEQLAALFISCGQVVDCRVCGDPNSVLRFAFVEFTDEEGARNALSLSGTMLGYYPVRVLPSKTAIAPVNPIFAKDEREMCARTIYCTNIDKKVTQADVKLFFESICGEVHRLRLLGDYHHSTRIAFVEFVMLRFLLFLMDWGVGVSEEYAAGPQRKLLIDLERSDEGTLFNLFRSLVLRSSYFLDLWHIVVQLSTACSYRDSTALVPLGEHILLSKAESAIAALNCSGAVLGSLPIRVSPSKTPVRPRAPRQSMH